MNDEERVLQEVKEVVERKNWVTFDTETTGLTGQVIQWAVYDPESSILGQGLVKPTIPVEPGARGFHGISDEILLDALWFPQAWRMIAPLLDGKEIVIYNADFDTARLVTSMHAHEMNDAIQHLRTLTTHCAMSWFSVIYGEWSDYHEDYTYQSLATACRYFGIAQPRVHQAGDDARVTAYLVEEMYKRAIMKTYDEEREEDEALLGDDIESIEQHIQEIQISEKTDF